MRELVRLAGKNMQAKSTGHDELFSVEETKGPYANMDIEETFGHKGGKAFRVQPTPNQQAEVAFQVLVGTMHAVAKIQGKHAFDMEVYEAAYAGICPFFPIC